jgi:hypothetical protein
MWIIVGIIIIGIILYFSGKNHNKEVQSVNLSNGGYRKSFSILTNHLENYYEMSFLSDNGRKFAFQKQIKDVNGDLGNLIIGVKLDMTDKPLLFSEFQSLYKGQFDGIPVSSVDFNSIETIDRSINISINKIKEQGVIDYSTEKNEITSHTTNSEFIEEWSNFNAEFSGTQLSETIDFFVNKFFVPDLIDFQKFIENYDILENSWKALETDYGTSSIKNIMYIPPAFDKFFISAYPDVYEWYQDNANKGIVEIHNKLAKMTDSEYDNYFGNPDKMREFYRSLVNQYKKTEQKLECTK